MNRRRFGRTGIEVSEVVIGAGWVGGILIDPDPDVMRRALRMSLDAGINWIDTAESYGAGVSETNVGWLVEELDAAERPGISTKARLDIESSETIASQLDRKIDASLKRLRMDSVDLYQLHNRIVAQT
ncbi:MAG: aldo/keto reductase, partial [Alphaproteobacteria bacterium]|nr:aldo/keto reductase [Alphaproteobacteria bacterium]